MDKMTLRPTLLQSIKIPFDLCHSTSPDKEGREDTTRNTNPAKPNTPRSYQMEKPIPPLSLRRATYGKYFNNLTHDERDVGSERHIEFGRRTFKAAKIRGSGRIKSVVTKKLKFDSFKKPKKPELLTLMTSVQTFKENIIQCPASDEIYVDPPPEN
ncbi:hypothetical protein AVEN_109098-1 [Araneus ventricosus]|uniref:Uncharacterized protein n=1 Tax=Araneus ventricosus TaxID=182803 RepID=A0A4Y2I954_ARAVE|nr:hypothetical protein AVEN_109098-1 [Araneus ventricosus]